MTLRSIIKQTYAAAELLVIDDGSSDGSPHIIEQTLKDCPVRCELIVRNSRGLCATLNEGFAQTSGEYFAYLGSDDVWLPEFLDHRVRLLQSRREAVLAYGHAYLIDENNRIVDCTADWAQYADSNVRQMLMNAIAPMSPTVLYRRTALEHERWNEQARLEDYEMYLRLSNGVFAFDPQVLSAWRRHGSNTSWDQMMMLDEQLTAQRNAADRLGYSSHEITTLQRVTKFRRAEDFLRIGDKKTAAMLMWQNLAGASLRSSARMLLRLGVPFGLIERRNAMRARKAHERYGSIVI